MLEVEQAVCDFEAWYEAHSCRQVDWGRVPDYMGEGLAGWVMYGMRPGGFLKAVLENDLIRACTYADDINQHLLWDYARFLSNYVPCDCYGSPENVKNWRGVLGK